MIGFLKPVDLTTGVHEYEFLEFYAGASRLARLSKAIGHSTTAMDREFDTQGDNKRKNNSMDFNTSAGFTSLTCNPYMRLFFSRMLFNSLTYV